MGGGRGSRRRDLRYQPVPAQPGGDPLAIAAGRHHGGRPAVPSGERSQLPDRPTLEEPRLGRDAEGPQVLDRGAKGLLGPAQLTSPRCLVALVAPDDGRQRHLPELVPIGAPGPGDPPTAFLRIDQHDEVTLPGPRLALDEEAGAAAGRPACRPHGEGHSERAEQEAGQQPGLAVVADPMHDRPDAEGGDQPNGPQDQLEPGRPVRHPDVVHGNLLASFHDAGPSPAPASGWATERGSANPGSLRRYRIYSRPEWSGECCSASPPSPPRS